VCADKRRDKSLICVVESIKDVMIVENTQQYRGVYHVLGGIISPMDGLGPADLNVNSLEQRLKHGGIKEIILALSATMEGDTTNFYLYRRLSIYDITFSTLARGVSIGDELEYTDEVTLGRSLINRVPFTAASS
jgi:recombination protein RecR